MAESNDNKISNQKNDPTANVLQLVAAAVDRLEDLRLAEITRVNDLRIQEAKRLDERMTLIASHFRELSEAEAKRIDAIRLVDVNAVAVASERASAQASVLASQVSQSAETLRALVSATATTVASQLTQISSQLTDRIALLEKSQYEGIGKGRLADPQLESLIAQVKILSDIQNTKQGSGDGMKNLWGLIVGGVLFLIAIISFFIKFN